MVKSHAAAARLRAARTPDVPDRHLDAIVGNAAVHGRGIDQRPKLNIGGCQARLRKDLLQQVIAQQMEALTDRERHLLLETAAVRALRRMRAHVEAHVCDPEMEPRGVTGAGRVSRPETSSSLLRNKDGAGVVS